MSLTITRLLGFGGPNLFGPQPGVALRLRARRDVASWLRDALKDGGQRAGLVIGALHVTAVPLDDDYHIEAHFTTPTPALGVELAQYAVAGMNARAVGDDSWDAGEQIWPLQQRRRAEALPLAALQLIAEARRRGIPAFQRADGRLQLGHGMRGMALDLAQLADDWSAPASARSSAAASVDWATLGPIPIIAVSGGDERAAVAAALVAALDARNLPATWVPDADFASARAALCQPGAARVVLTLSPARLFAQGLPFDACAACLITGLPTALPGADDTEIAQATALPLLVTAPAGRAIVSADAPELAALAAYAACTVHFQQFKVQSSKFRMDEGLLDILNA